MGRMVSCSVLGPHSLEMFCCRNQVKKLSDEQKDAIRECTKASDLDVEDGLSPL